MDSPAVTPEAVGVDSQGAQWTNTDSIDWWNWRVQYGSSSDDVKRQYIGNVGKKENGIVAVSAYGLVDAMIQPLMFEVYKPRERLKASDEYKTKPQIAAMMIRQLPAVGFRFELVLADSLYGESKTNFVNVLDELKLP